MKTDFARADWPAFQEQIVRELGAATPVIRHQDDLDAAVETVTRTIRRAADSCIPRTRILGVPSRPPLPEPILALIRHKRRLYRQFQRFRDPSLKTEWNRLNAVIRRKIAVYKERRWNADVSALNYKDGKQFWDRFAQLSGTRKAQTFPLTENGLPLPTEEVSEKFADFLEQVHRVNEGPDFDEFHRQRTERMYEAVARKRSVISPDGVRFEPFLPSDVADLLACPKKSAPGPDGITWTVLSHLPDPAIHYITHIFNSCISFSYFPDSWKIAKVIMIPKPGKNPSVPSSYRPISLLDTLGKLFEKLLMERLSRYERSIGILPDHQYGFRPQRSTTDALLCLHTAAAKAVSNGDCLAAALLDIERAYDTVWHAGLIRRLSEYQVPEYLILILISYLAGRRAFVAVLGFLSRLFLLRAGLPQGAVLSPLLYALFTAKVPSARLVRLAQYADDTAYYTVATNALAAGKRLQDALDLALAWMGRWRIRINAAKTQVILVKPRRTPRRRRFDDRDCAIRIHDKWVWPQNRVKYLGLLFDHHLRWTPELVRTLRHLRQRASLCYRLRGTIHGCGVRTLVHTYKCFVRPVAEYRWQAFIASGEIRQRLTQFERGFLRSILRLPRDFPSVALFEHPDVTLEPLVHRLLEAGRRYFERRSEDRPQFLANLESFPPVNTRRSRQIYSIPTPYEAVQDLEELLEAERDPEL